MTSSRTWTAYVGVAVWLPAALLLSHLVGRCDPQTPGAVVLLFFVACIMAASATGWFLFRLVRRSTRPSLAAAWLLAPLLVASTGALTWAYFQAGDTAAALETWLLPITITLSGVVMLLLGHALSADFPGTNVARIRTTTQVLLGGLALAALVGLVQALFGAPKLMPHRMHLIHHPKPDPPPSRPVYTQAHIRQALAGFPPSVTTGDERAVNRAGLDGVEIDVGITWAAFAPDPLEQEPIPVYEATDNEIVLGDLSIRLTRYCVLSMDWSAQDGRVYHHDKYTWDGTPVGGPSMPHGYDGYELGPTVHYLFEVQHEASEDLEFSDTVLLQNEQRMTTHQHQLAYADESDESSYIAISTRLARDDPVTLATTMFYPATRTITLPARPGATFVDGDHTVLLAGMFDHRFSWAKDSVPSTEGDRTTEKWVVTTPYGLEHTGPGTLLMLQLPCTWGLVQVRGVRHDGRLTGWRRQLNATRMLEEHLRQTILTTLRCATDELHEIQLRFRQDCVHLRFPLPNFRSGVTHPRGRRNLLASRFERISTGPDGNPYDILNHVLGRNRNTMPSPATVGEEAFHHDITLRELLDLYWPDQWYVMDNKLYSGQPESSNRPLRRIVLTLSWPSR